MRVFLSSSCIQNLLLQSEQHFRRVSATLPKTLLWSPWQLSISNNGGFSDWLSRLVNSHVSLKSPFYHSGSSVTYRPLPQSMDGMDFLLCKPISNNVTVFRLTFLMIGRIRSTICLYKRKHASANSQES